MEPSRKLNLNPNSATFSFRPLEHYLTSGHSLEDGEKYHLVGLLVRMTGNILEQGNPPRFMGEMVARLLAGMETLAEGRTHTGAVGLRHPCTWRASG